MCLYRSLDIRRHRPDDAQALAETITVQLLRESPDSLDAATISRTTYRVLAAYDGRAALRYGLDHGLV